MKKMLLVIWIIAGVAALLLRYEGALFISWWMWIVYAVILLALIGSQQPDDKKDGAKAEKAGDDDKIDREIADVLGGTPPSDDDGELDFSDLEAFTDDSLSDVSDIPKAIEEGKKFEYVNEDIVKKAKMGDAKAQCKVAYDYNKLGRAQVREMVKSLENSDPDLDRSNAYDELKKENIFCRKSVYWFIKAAIQGNAVAMTQIALLYECEATQLCQDYRKALYWYKQANKHGDICFGSCLSCCLGLDRLQEAEMWAERLAGDPKYDNDDKSQYFLEIVEWYDEHLDAPNAREGKEKWLKKAADLGDTEAQEELFKLKHAK